MFGLLVGTLNKAKTEDKQRSATDAVCSTLSSFHLSWSLGPFISHRTRFLGKKEAVDRAKAPG